MSESPLHSVFNILLEGEENGWIQMLVFAVLIGLSAVSSFAKQRKDKRKAERAKRPQKRPAEPAGRQAPSRAVEKEPAARPARPAAEPHREPPAKTKPRTIVRPGGALSAFVAEIKEEIKRAAEEMEAAKTPPPAKPKAAKKRLPAQPILEPEEQPRFVGKAAQKLELEELGGIMPEFDDPEDLKRAIIYLEILGKPVALRE